MSLGPRSSFFICFIFFLIVMFSVWEFLSSFVSGNHHILKRASVTGGRVWEILTLLD